MSVGKLDERGGFFYESLLKYSLAQSVKCRVFDMHQKLGRLAVVSDVVIPNASDPKVVVLVTHSFSENGTHMKTWRNIDEMLYVREHLPLCKIVNLIFPSEWKTGLVEVMRVICDKQIVFPERLARSLTKEAVRIVASGARPDEYEGIISKNIPLKPVVAYLRKSLDDAVRCERSMLWEAYSGSVPEAKIGSDCYARDVQFKKSLIRLLQLSDEDRRLALIDGEKNCKRDRKLRQRLENLGVVRRAIGFQYSSGIRDLLQYASGELVCNSLERLGGDFRDELDKICAPMIGGSEKYSLDVFLRDIANMSQKELSEYFVKKIAYWNTNHRYELNLPLYYLYTIESVYDQRFSHRILASRTDGVINSIWPLSKLMSGTPRESAAVKIGDRALRQLAGIFVADIAVKGMPDVNEVRNRLLYLVEDKLLKHKTANPLLYLCLEKCGNAGAFTKQPPDTHVAIGNGIVDYCVLSGLNVDKNAANTRFSFELTRNDRRYVFTVIAANAATHKHKEYPARWRCSTISYNGRSFVRTEASTVWVLILDGIWGQLFSDLRDTIRKFLSAGAACVIDVASWTSLEDVGSFLDGLGKKGGVMPKLSRENDDEILEAAEETKKYGKKR